MKKLAIGCFVVLVLGGALVVGVGYYGYLKVRSTVGQLAELGQIPEIERSVRVRTPFVVPASGELTANQVARFMQVQTRVRDRLGRNLEAFQRNYKALAEKKQATMADLPALIAAYRDMAAGWLDAKRAQVEALNDAGLSLQEYRWIRSEAYRALDVPFIDVDFARIAERARSGGPPDAAVLVGGALTGPGLASNLKLVERYRKQLEDYLPLAAFGL
ncbi:MAG TPA: hypothetical protein VEL79_10895 [Vicinamibacterales bacterium]|nr:hypothetical protein [Vicinamibacterales bacterium]